MRSILTLVFICFISLLTYGQEGLVAWNESKPLHWNDFSGKAKDTSVFDAEVFAEVRYTYQFNSLKDFHFDVRAHFDKSTSWSKSERQCEHLLKHEQTHFDIAELFARKMKADFETYNYTENFAAEILAIFNQKKLEYHAMQQRYDEETNHSLNKEKQKEWETYIMEQLDIKKQFK